MPIQTSKRGGVAKILAGFGLELAGAVLIWRTLPDYGEDAAVGVVAVVLGFLLIFWGVVDRGKRTAAPPPATVNRGVWLPEPELRDAPPRAVRLSRTGRRMVAWWSVLLMAIPVYAYFVTQRGSSSRADHSLDYVEGEATIHDKAVRESVRGKRFYLYYQFHAPAILGGVRASISVSESDYGRYNIGDPLTVLYLSPNPAVHEVTEFREKRSAPPAVWFAAGVMALFLVVFEMIRRRHKKLTRLGVASPGKVDMLRRRGAGCVYTVRCEAGGVESSLRATERGQAVREGDTITVLYLPEKPEQKLIYRASMYEAV